MKKSAHEVRKMVREGYAKVVKAAPRRKSSCGCAPAGGSSCCGGSAPVDISKRIGYSESDLKAIPEDANLGLGCGNPVALASLKKGETVLDLGSGAGIDCFLASRKVGPKGKVIGVDMTAEMLEKARANAAKGKFKNVEFRLGEIENLPVADNSVDAVISNCVINLSPDKEQVFKEVFRVLKPGGRMMVSDLVLTRTLPQQVLESIDAYIGCIAGASLKSKYLGAIRKAGFRTVEILKEDHYPVEDMKDDPTVKSLVESIRLPVDELLKIARSVKSVKVQALKPKKKR